MTRTLTVWWDGAVVGTLQVNAHGEMRFAYASAWLADIARPAISFSLPKREEPFDQRQCRPFFAGLLPEESQRDAIARALGFSTGNDFAFLEALGGDVAGALSLALFDAAVFNLIVGNADAHGKNFSLLHRDGGVTLAPFYDLLSTVAYPDLSPKLAMKMAGRATLEEIGPSTWVAFAEEMGLAAPFVRRRAAELAETVRGQVSAVAERPTLAGLDAAAIRGYARSIAVRAELVGRTAVPVTGTSSPARRPKVKPRPDS